mmetsp:Transcript_4981/g.12838  ORF Transcript_4981/g.12838 Transcript_4981/m.12838 type:complete len:474 (+) Transcript_4981:2166-3587(+)
MLGRDFVAHHHGRPLSGRCELQDREDRDLQQGAASGVFQLHHHAVGGAALEDKAKVPRPVAERRLIRAAGGVGQRAILLVNFRHHLMIDGKVQQQVVYGLVLRTAAAVEQLTQPVVREVHVRRSLLAWISYRLVWHLLAHFGHHIPLDLSYALAVDGPIDAELAEVHHVARQCASLVRENVLDLAHLLVEVRCPRHAADVVIHHVLVIVHEEDLEELDEGHGNQQRDRDEVGEEDDEVEEADDEDDESVSRFPILVGQVQVGPAQIGLAGVEHCAGQGRDEAEQALHQENQTCELASGHLQVGHLAAPLLLAVHHDLCLPAGVDRDTKGPRDVLDLAAAEEHAVLIEGHLLCSAAKGDVHRADKRVEELVGRLAVDVALHLRCAFDRRLVVLVLPKHPAEAAGSRLRLEVGLAIQVGRLNEDVALVVGAGEDDHVCGDELVVLDNHQVANPQAVPAHCLLRSAQGEAVILELV